MVLVRETMMADWQAWRDIRLQALRDAPDAFSSTYAEQNKLGEDHWRQRVAGGGLFLAWIPEVSAAEPGGMAGGYQAAGTVDQLTPWRCGAGSRGRSVGEATRRAGWARERSNPALGEVGMARRRPGSDRDLYDRAMPAWLP